MERPWELVDTPWGGGLSQAGPEATWSHPVPGVKKKMLPAIPVLQGSGHRPLQLPTNGTPCGGFRMEKNRNFLCFGYIDP